MKVFSIPFVFRDEKHFWDTLHGQSANRCWTWGCRRISGAVLLRFGRPQLLHDEETDPHVDDVRNMKVRVMNSRTAMDMIKAMGGSPCPISWGELYTALAQGRGCGGEHPPSFITSRHYEVCKYFTLTGISASPTC
jgi:TRAP-type C4-dicarboxylate transport system substrate-binding protein